MNKPINKTFTAGKWMPRDRETLNNWLTKIMDKAEKSTAPLKPVLEDFKNFIETDPQAYMFFNMMFDQVPSDKTKSPTGVPQVRDYKHMLQLFNVIMTHAPSFDETGLVGFPFNAILDWSMATTGGWAATTGGWAGFIDKKVNVYLKAILDEWGTFLKSKESTYVLSDDPKSGWFGADAKKAMPKFDEEFICDPSKPCHGFKCMTAKKSDDIAMAHTGFIFCRSPLSTMPRHSHSSKSGAKTETDRRVAHSGVPVSSCSFIRTNHSGASGMIFMIGSVRTAAARVTMTAIAASAIPPSRPKPLLSIGTLFPTSNTWLNLLLLEA